MSDLKEINPMIVTDEKEVILNFPNMDAIISINNLLQYAQIIPSVGKVIFANEGNVNQDQLEVAKDKFKIYLDKILDLANTLKSEIDNN